MAATAAKGRAMLQQYAGPIKRIEERYGVPGPILVAVWGRESGYGAAKIPYDAFEVLGTKAYLSRRKEMFRAELIAALRIVEDGDLTPQQMKSSWAGALGQPQFMPTKFRSWRSTSTVTATATSGTRCRTRWPRSRTTSASPAGSRAAAGASRRASPRPFPARWKGPIRGARSPTSPGRRDPRVSGRAFPAGEARATGHLLMPAGRFGPAFIATPNFYVIKEYNNSDLYALFIGHLADRMGGAGPFRATGARSRG